MLRQICTCIYIIYIRITYIYSIHSMYLFADVLQFSIMHINTWFDIL